MNRKFICLVKLVIGLAFLVGASTNAMGAEFYKGKVIRMIVGYSPGGGSDTYARAIARHIGKYIPGNPIFIVQNMPGAGSLVAANYTYNRAKPDGLTVGVFGSGLILQQALGARGIKFKADKFRWIGAPAKGLPVCAIMASTGLKSLQDVLNSKKPIKMGAERAGSVTVDLPEILNKSLGTNFKIIPGYKGTARIRLAMQKGEVDGACWDWTAMRVTAKSMLNAKGDQKLIPYIIQGESQDPEVKNLPQIIEVLKDPGQLAIFQGWMTQNEFQRPEALPPKTPKKRLNILRKAFKAALKDPQFLAETKKSRLVFTYVSGEQVEKYVDQLLAISPKAKKSLQFLVIKKRKGKS